MANSKSHLKNAKEFKKMNGIAHLGLRLRPGKAYLETDKDVKNARCPTRCSIGKVALWAL